MSKLFTDYEKVGRCILSGTTDEHYISLIRLVDLFQHKWMIGRHDLRSKEYACWESLKSKLYILSIKINS